MVKSRSGGDKALFSSETAKTYQASVNRYLKFTNKPLTLLSVNNHLHALKENGLSPATLQLDAGVMFRALIERARTIKELEQIKHVRKEINRLIGVKDQTSYTSESIAPEEIQAIILASPPRLALIIQALAETGLRVSELCGLKWSQENKLQSTKDHTFFKVMGKGRKLREVFFSNSLIEKIKEYGSKKYLFETVAGKAYNRTYIARSLSNLSEKAIGRRIHPHTLRHSFVTNELRAGTPIDAISQFVGHADKGFTVRKYAHNTLTPSMKQVNYEGK